MAPVPTLEESLSTGAIRSPVSEGPHRPKALQAKTLKNVHIFTFHIHRQKTLPYNHDFIHTSKLCRCLCSRLPESYLFPRQHEEDFLLVK